MKKCILAGFIIMAVAASFVSGAWYAIRFADAEYDEARNLHMLEVFGRSEYWFFEVE